MPAYYIASGNVRGDCGHEHATAIAAMHCMIVDQIACQRHGGYSDRNVIMVAGGRRKSVAAEQVADYLMDTAAVAARLGVSRSTISTYLARGRMPAPDNRYGGSPVWCPSTIELWIEQRPGQGAGGGRPRKHTG